MAEQTPISHPAERFADLYQSRFLQFGNEIHLSGDPDHPDDFARAQAYLETITHRCLASGVWDKQPADIVGELAYENEWHRYEVEQERRGGDRPAEYRAINLKQLRALSRRRVLAFEDMGWEVTQAYRVVNFFDHLIATAVLEQEALEQGMAASAPATTPSFESPADSSQDVPF